MANQLLSIFISVAQTGDQSSIDRENRLRSQRSITQNLPDTRKCFCSDRVEEWIPVTSTGMKVSGNLRNTILLTSRDKLGGVILFGIDYLLNLV